MTEFKNNGEIVVYEDIVRKIKERDYFDMNRKISPLTKAKEAIVIDTTDLDIKEQIKKIISIVNNK
jgi:cytidylate kinase